MKSESLEVNSMIIEKIDSLPISAVDKLELITLIEKYNNAIFNDVDRIIKSRIKINVQ